MLGYWNVLLKSHVCYILSKIMNNNNIIFIQRPKVHLCTQMHSVIVSKTKHDVIIRMMPIHYWDTEANSGV